MCKMCKNPCGLKIHQTKVGCVQWVQASQHTRITHGKTQKELRPESSHSAYSKTSRWLQPQTHADHQNIVRSSGPKPTRRRGGDNCQRRGRLSPPYHDHHHCQQELKRLRRKGKVCNIFHKLNVTGGGRKEPGSRKVPYSTADGFERRVSRYLSGWFYLEVGAALASGQSNILK